MSIIANYCTLPHVVAYGRALEGLPHTIFWRDDVRLRSDRIVRFDLSQVTSCTGFDCAVRCRRVYFLQETLSFVSSSCGRTQIARGFFASSSSEVKLATSFVRPERYARRIPFQARSFDTWFQCTETRG